MALFGSSHFGQVHFAGGACVKEGSCLLRKTFRAGAILLRRTSIAKFTKQNGGPENQSLKLMVTIPHIIWPLSSSDSSTFQDPSLGTRLLWNVVCGHV